ncbi:MAG TPA: radical SAM protein [Ruminococcaceae bacterium]|jgi:TatD family-associated radical SAM protein|nr:radical SAM protein [Oscillospiraceae bacterium]HBQ45634.1 radical SAM protein [Oscillospiraceae bacterium]HBT90567.1 radical SAM protein [Oscillospiraceae bacterium]HCB91679.1 radical SAM protein [Oscillospiraceae bacterium]
MTICYGIADKLYLNLTNRCNNNCTFCLRRGKRGIAGYDLRLKEDPTAEAVNRSLDRLNLQKYAELVYCGFGEPTLALDVLLKSARHVRESSRIPIRLNTNGLANLAYQTDITPKLHGLVDTVSISLNAKNAREYNRLCRPAYGEAAFGGLLDFARRCAGQVPKVVFTVVDILPGADIEACRKIAREAGAELRVRRYQK